jgi:diketogulonate reductase-like aldo/keto reductase
MDIHHISWVPLAKTPTQNSSIDELPNKDAKSLTQFNKEQLHQLLLHWRIPAVVVIDQWYCFSREELLIVCLAKLATGDP